MLENYGISFGNVATAVGNFAKDAEAIVAHNGNRFDKLFWEAAVRRGDAPAIDVLWIDTCTDLELPDGIRSRHLKYLAAEHGFLNPFSHRAVFDVLTMMTIFSQYPVETTMRLAAEPTVNLQALVSYDARAKASVRGYAWKPETKQWIKSLKLSRVEREQTECGFKTVKVGV
jgi:DNA polymerase-3 subunit epsilon